MHTICWTRITIARSFDDHVHTHVALAKSCSIYTCSYTCIHISNVCEERVRFGSVLSDMDLQSSNRLLGLCAIMDSHAALYGSQRGFCTLRGLYHPPPTITIVPRFVQPHTKNLTCLNLCRIIYSMARDKAAFSLRKGMKFFALRNVFCER